MGASFGRSPRAAQPDAAAAVPVLEQASQATSGGCACASGADAKGPTSGAAGKTRPPNREEIGRAAWRYVHTMAAHYPEAPSMPEQVNSLAWLRSFVQFYPCGLCAREFVDVCRGLPPRLTSRLDYAMWWCEAHNRVRDDLSQPPRRCEASELLSLGLQGMLPGEKQQHVAAPS
eukprot:TRINITY_DN58974_c0_g1_i1.p1 TRINITY_DN58974_c0_g1~~TRINITY_DN58974_c0_g1_i1.p1  ORF type:complete len:174 (+),score=27.59 TRINITY_DN58974_c0_g1_i1:80-601(+)